MAKLFKVRGSPYWYYKTKSRGEWKNKSTRQTKKSLVAKVWAEAEARRYFASGQVITEFLFSDLAPLFLAWRETERPRSVRGETGHIKALFEHFGPCSTGEIGADEIESYVERCRRRKLSGRSINLHLATLRAVLKYAVRHRRLAALPEIPRQSETDSHRREPVPADSVGAIIAAAHNPEHALALSILYHSGIRRTELCRLTWQDVDLDGRTIHLSAAQTKNGQPRDVLIEDDDLIQAMRSVRGIGKIWRHHSSTLTHWTTEAMQTAGVWRPGSSCHAFRHLFATELIESGVDPETVKNLGGWQELRMVDCYSHGTEQRQRSALRGRKAEVAQIRRSE